MATKDDRPTKRQAVVVVHGIGEQKPGETLDNILKGLGKADALAGSKLVYVPDRRTGSRELYRVTTVNPEGDESRRTDFYEFYWADIMAGNTFDDVKAWVSGLLVKRFGDVPPHVRKPWYWLWALTMVIVLLAVLTVFTLIDGQTYDGFVNFGVGLIGLGLLVWALKALLRSDRTSTEKRVAAALRVGFVALVVIPMFWLGIYEFLLGHPATYLAALLGVVIYFVRRFLIPYVGDVARYTQIKPETVAKRAEVINRGLALLRSLHGMNAQPTHGTSDDNSVPDYDRVIVVAHSLGSIIAYDLLRHLWMECGPVRGGVFSAQGMRSLKRLGELMVKWENGDKPFEIDALRAGQRSVCADLAQTPGAWRVSDFVTIGSPLTHGEFLLGDDRETFQSLIEKGLLPTLPPRLYDAEGQMLSAHDAGLNPLVYESDDILFARHTAAFAATRWTNIYDDPQGGIFKGDVVSGGLRSLFGIGISDVDMTIRRGGKSRLFTHTSYWLPSARAILAEPPDWIASALGPDVDKHHLDALAAAMDLSEKPRPETDEA